MGRYRGPKEKLERRIGEKLFLKGERSLSPKSAMVKRPYPPGEHGKKRAKRLSEYGTQLRKKQKVRIIYGLLEKKFKRYVTESMSSPKETTELLVKTLESRLDNVVYRMGIGQSRNQARQLVNHGHILVNKKKVSIPSFETKKGDVIEIREGSKKAVFFTSLAPQWIEKADRPTWIKFNTKDMVGEITGVPTIQDSGLEYGDLQGIVEFYSR